MSNENVVALVKDLDRRLAVVEQILPTLPTRDEVALKTDLDRFATKEDLERFATKEDLERFATKEDLERFATKEDLERFATKEDLKRFATREDLAQCATKSDLERYATAEALEALGVALRQEIADVRTHMLVLHESLRQEFRIVLEVMTSRFDRLDARLDEASRRDVAHETRLDDHEVRLRVLERRKRRAD